MFLLLTASVAGAVPLAVPLDRLHERLREPLSHAEFDEPRRRRHPIYRPRWSVGVTRRTFEGRRVSALEPLVPLWVPAPDDPMGGGTLAGVDLREMAFYMDGVRIDRR